MLDDYIQLNHIRNPSYNISILRSGPYGPFMNDECVFALDVNIQDGFINELENLRKRIGDKYRIIDSRKERQPIVMLREVKRELRSNSFHYEITLSKRES